MTRSELIDHIRARRVVVDQVRGDKARITIDFGRRSTCTTVPTDWIRPLLTGQLDAKAVR